MASIKHFSFSDNTKIVAQSTDVDTNFIWVSYLQNSSGNCILQKQSAFSPDEIYFSLTRAINKIKDITVVNSSVFTAYEDTVLLGEIFSTTNPLTSTTKITRPGGLVENPIAVVAEYTNYYEVIYLTPGNSGGQNAKLIKYNFIGNYNQTINLPTVFNAESLTIDANNNIWLVTNTNPANIVRVYQTSPNVWAYAITPIV